MNFRAKFEVVLQKQFLLVVVNHSKSDFSTAGTVNRVAFSEEIRQVYSTEILSNTATTRVVNSTEIDSVCLNIVQRETTQNYAPLQRRTNSHNFKNLD